MSPELVPFERRHDATVDPKGAQGRPRREVYVDVGCERSKRLSSNIARCQPEQDARRAVWRVAAYGHSYGRLRTTLAVIARLDRHMSGSEVTRSVVAETVQRHDGLIHVRRFERAA